MSFLAFYSGITGKLTQDSWAQGGRHTFHYITGAHSIFLFLWPCSLAVPVLAGWIYVLLWFYIQELPKAQLEVVLVLKRLRRRGNGLKSHPTDWAHSILCSVI